MDAKLAIVILNWNGRRHLEAFLPSVIRYSSRPDYKVVVADNHSIDDSVEFLQREYPQIELIRFKANYGFAKGYSLSLPQIRAEYYVLLNSDVEVTPDWVEPIIRFMDLHPEVGAMMPKILAQTNKEFFEYAGAAGGYIDKYGYPFCRGRILTHIEKDHGQYNDYKQIFWASGACMFMRASAYSRTGGLDGDFFAHMEEIDLCWRLKRLGYTIWYCPESVVYHVGGGTLPNDNPRKLYYNYRNSLYLLFKNLERKQFFTILIPRMLLDGVSAVVYLLQGKMAFFMSVFRAHIRFYANLSMLITKRKVFNSIIAKNEVSQIFPGSVVKRFFLKGMKTFDQYNY